MILSEKFIKSFWSKIIKKDGCWEWTAATKGKDEPYGIIGFGKKTYKAHRVSWFLHFGEIPKGMFVCHSCDNPNCTNPKHLFLGTPKENHRDMMEKGRNSPPPKGPPSNKINMPNNSEILKELAEVSGMQLAKKYKVSKYVIYRWRKENNISCPEVLTKFKKNMGYHPCWDKKKGVKASHET